MLSKSFVTLFAVLSLIAVAGASTTAQEYRATISGQIADKNGAVLPGATVTVTNEQTNAKAVAQSNDEGNYTIPFLVPGNYAVAVEAANFKTSQRSGVVVEVAAKLTVNFALEAGSVSEVVEVSADDSSLLQQQEANLGQVVTRLMMDRLPLIGRSPLDMADLTPGVVAPGAGFGGYTGNQQSDIVINGGSGSSKSSDISIDGLPSLVPRAGGLATGMPQAEAVQEFKVQTTLFDAANGHARAGAISVTTRSGSNNYSGSLYSYVRPDSWTANSWTNNSRGLPKSPSTNKLWGGTVGGPVKLPRFGEGGSGVFSGRDRTFFFTALERYHIARPLGREARVPTAKERIGDFSETLAPNGTKLRLFDPFSTVVDSSGRFVSRTEIPNANLAAYNNGALLNPIGLKVLSLNPLPNLTGRPNQLTVANWATDRSFYINGLDLQTRIDHQVSTRQRIYARFSWLDHYQEPDLADIFPGAYNVPTRGTADLNRDNRRMKTFSFDDTFTFTNNFVGSFRFGFARLFSKNSFQGDDLDPVALGLPASLLAGQFGSGVPIFNLSGSGENLASVGSNTRYSVNNLSSAQANFSLLQGDHSVRWGADYRLIRWEENTPGDNANGNFVFARTFTQANPTNNTTRDFSGSAMASLLMGLPSSGGIGGATALSLQSHYLGLYVQDDYKVARNLTLNLGLRWELETPFTERFNRLAYDFDSTANTGITAPNFGPLRGGLRFVGENGVGRQQGNIDWNNFGPRVGFAYTMFDKTVLRGGYGIFFGSAVNDCCNNTFNPQTIASFSATTNYTGSSNSDITPLPGVSLNNPFPNGLRTPNGTSAGTATELGNAISFYNSDRKLPYTQQWTINVQQQLPWQLVGEVAYVGTHTLSILDDFNLNDRPDAVLGLTNTVTNPFFGVLGRNTTVGAGATRQLRDLSTAFPYYSSVTIRGINSDRAKYHGLQAKIQKRFSQGLSFISNYTWSKSMYFNVRSLVNSRDDYTVSELDRKHLFRTFVTYDLPVGRGRSFGSSLPRAFDQVLGGWAMTWVTKYSSGQPLSISTNNGTAIPTGVDPNVTGSTGERLGDVLDPLTRRPTNPYFNINAFTQPAANTPDLQPSRFDWLRSPSYFEHSVVFFKTFNLFGETGKFEVRGEINNPFNTPRFGSPTTAFNSADFGRVITGGNARFIQIGGKFKF